MTSITSELGHSFGTSKHTRKQWLSEQHGSPSCTEGPPTIGPGPVRPSCNFVIPNLVVTGPHRPHICRTEGEAIPTSIRSMGSRYCYQELC